MVVGVVDADVEYTLAALAERLVEVDAQIQPVVGRHPVVVAPLEIGRAGGIDESFIFVVGGGEHILHGQRTADAAAEDEGAREVDLLVELVVDHEAQVVPAVILGREGLAEVDDVVFPVEKPHGARPGVAQPAGGVAGFLLDQELHAVGPSAPHRHLVFPSCRGTHEGGAVAVLHHVVHGLVVPLHGEVELPAGIKDAGRPLPRAHRGDAVGDRHPEVGGQREVAVREQVQILAHLGVGGLEGEVVAEEQAETQAGFQRLVGFGGSMIQRPPEPGVELEPVGQRPVVFCIEGRFAGEQVGVAEGGVLLLRDGFRPVGVAGLHADGGHRGLEGMEDIVGAEADVMFGSGLVLEIGSHRDVVDQGVVTQVRIERVGGIVEVGSPGIRSLLLLIPLIHTDRETVAVTRVVQRGVHEELGREDVVPAGRRHHVAPLPAQVHPVHVAVRTVGNLVVAVFLGITAVVRLFDVGVHVVVAAVEADVEFVVVRKLMRQLAAQVVEVVTGRRSQACLVQGDGRQRRGGENIVIGAAQRKVEGGLALDDRAFHVDLGREQAHREAPVELLVVAVLEAHVHHAGEAAAEPCRETALVERHVFDGIRIEDGEKAHHVVHVVERHAVEQQQVLVRTAAADIEAGRTFRTGLHAGQQLQGLEDVHLAADGRNALDLGHRHLDGAHLRTPDADFGVGGGHHGAGQLRRNGRQPDIEKRVAHERERHFGGRISHIGIFQGMLTGGERQRIVAEVVGHGSLPRGGFEHGCAQQRLTRSGVGHIAADRHALLCAGGERHESQQQGRQR